MFASSDIVGFGTFNSDLAIFRVTFTEVLSDFSLERGVIPMHISLDQVHNRADITREQ